MTTDGSQFAIAIFCYLYKTVIVIVKLRFVTARKNFCNRFQRLAKRRSTSSLDVVFTVLDPVIDSQKTFRQNVVSFEHFFGGFFNPLTRHARIPEKVHPLPDALFLVGIPIEAMPLT